MINDSPSIPNKISLKISYRILLFFLILLIFLPFFIFLNPVEIYCSSTGALYDDNIEIRAESAVIVNYETGEILWGKNYSQQMYPASLTKMLSSIIAIENIDNLNEVIKISKNASGKNHSAFKFKTGDKISLIDLLKAALIVSHNNATIALAEYVSGNIEDFVELMNKKAKEIGANNSFFQNTNGLDDKFPYHKSTAADIAKIAHYCMKNELFREIVSTEKDIIKINDKEVEITNTNNLLEDNYIKGIKTGYTNNAGFCIAIYSEKDDLKLITVVLNEKTQEERNSDVLKLLTWAYNNLKYTKIIDSEKPAAKVSIGNHTILDVDLYPETDYVKLINIKDDVINFENKINNNINLPARKNDVMGTVTVLINGEKIKELNLISLEDTGNDYIYQELSDTEYKQTIFVIIFLIVFYFLIIITIIVRNLLLRRIL